MGKVPDPAQDLNPHRCGLVPFAADSDDVWSVLQKAGEQLAIQLVSGQRQIFILVQRNIVRLAGNVFRENQFLRFQLSRKELMALASSQSNEVPWAAFKKLFVDREGDLSVYNFREVLRWLGYR